MKRRDSLRIVEHVYRGKRGFLLCGKRAGAAFSTSVFVRHRTTAELVKECIRNGDHDGADRAILSEQPPKGE